MPQSFVRTQAQVRAHIRSYLRARQRLTDLKILRTGRSLQADYAEWVAGRLLHLTLAKSAVQAHWDAKDSRGRTYQVKSRVVKEPTSTTAFHFGDALPRFDFLVCVFFGKELEVLALIKVPHSVVRDLIRRNKRGLRFRWNRRVAADPRVQRVVWGRAVAGN